jgi:phosphoenolpyruvate synthase/pyruvate phosphate dikinase
MENSPSLALVLIYESDVFNADSPSGYTNERIREILDELERLGFDVININPLLNDEIKYIINSTIRHEKRVNLMSGVLKGNYDYFLYINIRNSYTTITNTDDYKIDIAARFKLLNTSKKEETNDNNIDEELFYDVHDIKTSQMEARNMGRNDLKRKSLEQYIDFILNFVNNYVKTIRNYEYALEGKDPICLNLNYKASLI